MQYAVQYPAPVEQCWLGQAVPHAQALSLMCHADTLSDSTSRQLYDEYGPEGMQRHQGAASGQGNAQSAWDEFKPFKKENKHTRARDSARAGASGSGAEVDDADTRSGSMFHSDCRPEFKYV